MLGGLFKSGLQSDSIEKRLQAIAKLELADTASQTILENLATNDVEQRVRYAALYKISRPSTLFQIIQTHSDAQTREDAKSAFRALIGPKSSLTENEFQALIAEHPDSKPLIAQHCPHSSLRSALFNDIPELEQASLIADVEYTDTRKLIADQLHSQAALELARKNLKGKDKSAEKTIRAKLERIRAEQKQEQENHASAESLCEKMEFIANHPEWRAEFKDRFTFCERRWQDLSFTPGDTLQRRYTLAQVNAKAKVEQQIAIEIAQQAQTDLAQELQAYCVELASCSLPELIDRKPGLNAKLNAALSAWLQQTETVTPTIAIADSFLGAQKALKSLGEFGNAAAEPENIAAFEKSLKLLHWPNHYPALQAKSEAKALVSELRSQNKQAQQSEKETLDKLHKRINRLLGSTKRGDLKRAQHELAATTKAASHFSGKDKAALDERLTQAAEAVSKMADWQAFATEPKFIELCESMEALNESTAHADKLAKKINTLQQRWKALGHSEVADQHWERFKAAADRAYEPCSVFFKQRRETQRANLAQREPLVDRMRALLENTQWDDEPDYKQVEIELRNIGNEWQKIKDVERGPGQKQWERLSEIRAAIYQKLDVVYDANIELKHQIIAQVEALLDTDVKEESIAKLQLFQNRWKQIGVTRRKQDQVAWKKFKDASDKVYAKIQGLRQEKRAEEDNQLQGYRDIIKKIQSLAKTATELTQADANFDSLQADYQALPSLPKNLPEKLINGISADFQRAVDAYNKARERMSQAAKAKTLDKLAEKAALCAQLERLGSKAAPEQIEAIQIELAAIQLLDKSLDKRFELRLASALDADKQRASEVRQRLCIDLEILLGVESPAQDKNMRMQIQLERMKKQGIGHSPLEKKSMLNEFKLDWLCLPGAEPEIQASLDQRFQHLISTHS